MENTNHDVIKMDWSEFPPKFFQEMHQEQAEEIYGQLFITFGKSYLADVHWVNDRAEPGVDIEVYETNAKQEHLTWIGAITDLENTENYKTFQSSVRQALQKCITC